MKKIISLLLILMLALSAAALGEEGWGEKHIIEDLPTELGEAVDTEPGIPEGLERTIFGTDDRVTVSNPSAYPYSAICNVVATGECGCTLGGTGFMVNKNVMLTAAHSLFCCKHQKWIKTVDFYFGYKSRKNYLYRYNGRWSAWAGTSFGNGYDTTNDIGYVKFEKNVGETTGWFGMHWGNYDKLDGYTFCVAGYRDGVLKYDYGRAETYKDNLILYHADMLPGNSGGPVFDSEYYAVAVNIAESSDYNYGHRITGFIRDQLISDGLF